MAGAGEYDVPVNCVPVASRIVGWVEPTELGKEVGSTHPTILDSPPPNGGVAPQTSV
jgi:hypothetical protein